MTHLNNRPRIVYSMTTIPPRLCLIEPVIKNILERLIICDALYLNLPYISMKGKPYVISDKFLSSLKEEHYRKVIINRCETDMGPITKILPTFYRETDPTTLIVSIDDDVILKKDISLPILKNHMKFPNSCLSFSGFCVGKFPFIFQFAVGNETPLCVDWVQGVHTITYPRRLIKPDELMTWKTHMTKHDDHRLNSYLAYKCIDRISMGYKAKEYLSNVSDIASTDQISGNIDFIIQNAKITYGLCKENLYGQNNRILYASSISGLILISLIWILIIVYASSIMRNKYDTKISFDIFLIILFAAVLSVFLFVTVSNNMLV